MDISLNFDTPKESVAVFIICDNKLLLTRYKYEGVWVCGATQGTFFKKGDDPLKKVIEVEREQLGITLVPKFACTIESYINKPKPDGRVRLRSLIYLLEITEESKSQIKKNNQFRWLNLEEINESKIIREDDKLIFSRFLSHNHKDLIMDVDQMGKWGRPKLLDWSEA